MSVPEVAYIARGEIHVRSADGGMRTFISKFGEQLRNRALRIEQRNAWKETGRAAMFQRGGMPIPPHQAAAEQLAITSLAALPGGHQLVYALDSSTVTAVLELDPTSGEEQRLFHSNQTRICDLAPALEDDRIACTLRHDTGASSIAVIDRSGGGVTELTEGDSVDSAPSWRGTSSSELVFQSQGIGRGQGGEAVGLGPAAIHRLHLEEARVEVLLEDSDYDYLVPRIAADGTLYCIRRPYEDGSFQPRPLQVLKGILLFPFHLAMVAFNIVDHLTQTFGRKPLLRAGGGNPPVDQRLVVLGRAIELGEAAKGKRRRNKGVDPEAPLVPDQWQLLRQRPGQTAEVIASHVLAFDLTPDGGGVYTTGTVLNYLDAAGRTTRLGRVERATHVVTLG